MQGGQLLLCSFSSVDIGFCSIIFADALISLEYINIIVKYQLRNRSDY